MKWTYTWPGGLRELLDDGRASGTFLTVNRTDSLTVEFVPEKHAIKEFGVVYYDSTKVRLLHEGNRNRRGFEIESPLMTQIVQFDVQI